MEPSTASKMLSIADCKLLLGLAPVIQGSAAIGAVASDYASETTRHRKTCGCSGVPPVTADLAKKMGNAIKTSPEPVKAIILTALGTKRLMGYVTSPRVTPDGRTVNDVKIDVLAGT